MRIFRPSALAVVIGILGFLAPPAHAAEDYKITRCPPDLPYCIQETKKAYSPAEIAAMNTVKIDPEAEARKAKLRVDTGYRDPPIVRDTCPPPYRMDEWDGCHAAGWKSSRAERR